MIFMEPCSTHKECNFLIKYKNILLYKCYAENNCNVTFSCIKTNILLNCFTKLKSETITSAHVKLLSTHSTFRHVDIYTIIFYTVVSFKFSKYNVKYDSLAASTRRCCLRWTDDSEQTSHQTQNYTLWHPFSRWYWCFHSEPHILLNSNTTLLYLPLHLQI